MLIVVKDYLEDTLLSKCIVLVLLVLRCECVDGAIQLILVES